MPTSFIIHGIYGNPQENWFPWMKTELEKLGIDVFVPHLPTVEPLKPEHWWDAFQEYEEKITTDSILIGHSLGAAFVLKLLEKHRVHSAFLVAPAWGKTGNEFDPVMSAVADQDFDWERIKSHAKNLVVFHADDDPYLPLERGETLSKKLDAKLHVVKGAGHFNSKAGYTSFPLLLEEIKKLTSS